MKTFKYIYLLLLLLPVLGKAGITPPVMRDTLDPYIEIRNIEFYYKAALANSGIDEWDFIWPFSYTETDKDVCYSTVLDTDTVNLQVYYDKLVRSKDGFTVVQDSLYNLLVDDSAKAIYVSTPEPVYKQILDIDLMDPYLYNQLVKDINVYDSSGVRVIYFRFHNEAPYFYYRIVYHPDTYHLVKLEYALKKEVIEPGQPYFEPPTYTKIEWTSLGLTQNHVATDPNLFSTQRFVKWLSGKLVPVESYADYTIINTTNP